MENKNLTENMHKFLMLLVEETKNFDGMKEPMVESKDSDFDLKKYRGMITLDNKDFILIINAKINFEDPKAGFFEIKLNDLYGDKIQKERYYVSHAPHLLFEEICENMNEQYLKANWFLTSKIFNW